MSKEKGKGTGREERRMKKIKRKILFYKALLVEMVETLCTICLYLYFEGTLYHHKNPKAIYMRDHFEQLKQASSVLRKEMSEEMKEK